MSPRRFTAFAALCGTVILGASVTAGFAGFRSHVVENVTAPIQASRSTSASTDAETVDVPQATAKGHDTVPAAEGEPGSVENDGRQATNSVETLDDCSMAEICVDQYLWSTYQRARKVDTIKVPEQIKVTVKRKGKTRVVSEYSTA